VCAHTCDFPKIRPGSNLPDAICEPAGRPENRSRKNRTAKDLRRAATTKTDTPATKKEAENPAIFRLSRNGDFYAY
jgi:hypothetical protein